MFREAGRSSVLLVLARGEALTQQRGSRDVPFGRFERCLVDLLQVRGLRQDQQFVDRGNFQLVDQIEVDPQTDARQQMQSFFRRDGLSAAEDAERAGDLVVQLLAVVAHPDQAIAKKLDSIATSLETGSE